MSYYPSSPFLALKGCGLSKIWSYQEVQGKREQMDEGFEDAADDTSTSLPSYLREPLVDAVEPPASREVALLPFHQRSFEDFERICLVIAERVEGLRDPRLYGRRSQRQHGIDIVAWDSDGERVVFQSRRWVSFTAGNLRAAVADFAEGRRPFGPKRFVVCVSAIASDTDTLEALAEVREQYDFDVDLYDGERLSSMLRERPDLVRLLFGQHWVAAFCGGEGVQPIKPPAENVLAEALLRGPLQALGLARQVQEAETASETGDAATARALYGDIASQLNEHGWVAQSASFRRLEAQAAATLEDLPSAVAILSRLAWKTADAPDSSATANAIHEMEALGDENDPRVARVLATLRHAQEWFANPWMDLKDMAAVIVAVANDSLDLTIEAILWFAETTLPAGETKLLLGHEDLLRLVIEARMVDSRSDPIAVRLRLCLADATGEWQALDKEALRGYFDRRETALVHARHARFLAWTGNPDEALSRYRLAVDQACLAALEGEAAKFLRSIFDLGARFGFEDESWWEAPALTARLRAQQQYLARSYDFRTYGLEALREEKLPTALRHFKAYLRDSVIVGDLNGELAAHGLIADVYQRAEELELAARHLIRAGKHKLVRELMRSSETYIDLTDLLDTDAPWVLATALSALAAEGGLLPDEIVRTRFADLIDFATRQQRQAPFGPLVWLSATEVLAAIASRIPTENVRTLLDIFEPAIEREDNQYRWDDDQHVQVVLELFRGHPSARDDVSRHLLRLFEASPDLARRIMGSGFDVVEHARAVFVPQLRVLADSGRDDALEVLLLLGEEHPRLLTDARKHLDVALSQSGPDPGVRTIGSTLPRSALFVRLLPEVDRVRFAMKAMEQAEDAAELEVNRSDALGAVMVLAHHLPQKVRSELFQRALSLGLTDHAGESGDEFDGVSHPLSAFRFDVGVGSLRPRAVFTAATLAEESGEFDAAIQAALALLNVGDDQVVREAAHALATLAKDAKIDPNEFVRSPTVALRELAAVLWGLAEQRDEDLGERLASDSSARVRMALAMSLGKVSVDPDRIVERLRQRLLEDPSASVRELARGFRMVQASDLHE